MSDRMIHGGWIVAPVVSRLRDNGTYEEVQVQPARIAPGQWEAFKAGGDAEALESVRRQVETAPDGDQSGQPPEH